VRHLTDSGREHALVSIANKIGWTAAGFAAATAVAALFAPGEAAAQSTSRTAVTAAPRKVPIEQRRAGQPPQRPTDFVVEPTEPAAEPVDPEAEQAEAEDGEPVPRIGRGQRRILRDGDPLPPQEQPNTDGQVLTGEPVAPADGADPTLVDSRPAEDVAAFDDPPAGFDARAFTAEIEPILDRRPLQLFRFEPYTQKGIRTGTLVWLPEVELTGGWFSNIFRSSSARSDVAAQVRPTIRVVSDWRRHAFEASATGLASWLAEFPSENDRAYTLETRGRLDFSRRTNIEGALARDVTQESRSSINAVQSADRRTDVTTDRGALTFNHRFNRLALQLRGSVTDIGFDDTGTGVLNRDYTVYEEAGRATWEFKPTLFAFVEAGLNQRDYKAIPSADGISRNSSGERYRVGVSFGNTSQKLRGEASIGYARQRPDDSRLSEITGVIVDANIAYRVNALTTVLLTARSDVAETTVAGSGGALQRGVSAEVRHAFLRQLIGTAGLSYTVQNYEGVDLDERELRAGLGLEYFLNAEVQLFSTYQHTIFNSTDRGRNYDADEVRVGLRLRR
jgi:hypothetical protein